MNLRLWLECRHWFREYRRSGSGMEEKVIVDFINCETNFTTEIEIPLDITANDLAMALNQAYELNMDMDNKFNCYLISENPIAFLRGNKTLREFGIRKGTIIIYTRR